MEKSKKERLEKVYQDYLKKQDHLKNGKKNFEIALQDYLKNPKPESNLGDHPGYKRCVFHRIPIYGNNPKDFEAFIQVRDEIKEEFFYIFTLASESRDFKKPSESRIFEFDKKLFKYGTLQAKQK